MINLTELDALVLTEVNFDEDLADLYPSYFENVKKDFNILQSSNNEKNYLEVDKIAHKIKGSAASYGLDVIDQIVRMIEEQSKLERYDEITVLVQYFENYLNKAISDYRSKNQ